MKPLSNGNSTILAQTYSVLLSRLSTPVQGIPFCMDKSTYSFIENQLTVLRDSGNFNTNKTGMEACKTLYDIVYILIFQQYGVEVAAIDPSSDPQSATNSVVNQVMAIYILVFIYIFVAAGFVLIMLGITLAYGEKDKDMGHCISVGVRLGVGSGHGDGGGLDEA